MKKFLLTLSLLFAAMSASAFNIVDDNLEYVVNDGADTAIVILTRFEEPIDVLTIPEKVEYNGAEYTVTALNYGVFKANQNLNKVILPSTLHIIDNEAFMNSSITEIEIPEGVTTIGFNTFNGCSNLTSITVPNSVTNFNSTNFCSDCTSLKTAKIGNGTKQILSNAFYNCTSLESVELGSSVDFVNSQAFWFCDKGAGDGITSFTCYAVNPPSTNYQILVGVNKEGCILYVPEGSVEAYQNSTDVWSRFIYIEPIPGTGVDKVGIDTEEDAPAVYYNLNGSKVVGEPTQGLYIARKGAKASKVVVK